MVLLVALLTIAFAGPSVEPAKPGPIGEKLGLFYYVIAAEGSFRVEKQKAIRAPKVFHPAFVLSSETKFRVATKPVERGGVTVAANQVRYSDGFVVRKGASSVTAHEVETALAVVVAPAGDEYLLVCWHSDSGKCEFSLFAIDGEMLKEAATNAYGCER
jgi:hypothetical protein